MEGAGRIADISHRIEGNLLPKSGAKKGKFAVKNACKLRKINFEFQPEGMEKSRLNQTEFNHAAETVFWTVELVFVSLNGSVSVRLHRIPESIRLETLCGQILTDSKRKVLDISLEQKESLENFRSVFLGLETLVAFYKLERIPAKFGQKFVEFSLNKSIQENLESHVVVEFPKIFIVAPYRLNLDDKFPQATTEELADFRKRQATVTIGQPRPPPGERKKQFKPTIPQWKQRKLDKIAAKERTRIQKLQKSKDKFFQRRLRKQNGPKPDAGPGFVPWRSGPRPDVVPQQRQNFCDPRFLNSDVPMKQGVHANSEPEEGEIAPSSADEKDEPKPAAEMFQPPKVVKKNYLDIGYDLSDEDDVSDNDES